MTEAFIFDENKEYDHREVINLLGKVREFFQSGLKVIIPEWTTHRDTLSESANIKGLGVFYIEKACDPIYSTCNGYADLGKVLNLFSVKLDTLLDNMDKLLDNNVDLDDESKKSLESYASVINKCSDVYNIQKKRRSGKFSELSTVDEIKDELRNLFGEIIANYIIVVLFDALYERINNSAGSIYELVVKEINEFLSENGVYTKKVSVGEKIDPEFMEPTPDSSENYTEDFNKFDTINEVRRYPYLFTDGSKIIDGQAKIWRRKD